MNQGWLTYKQRMNRRSLWNRKEKLEGRKNL